MKACIRSVMRFLAEEDGPTAVEYAFMLALIIVVCVSALQFLGSATSTTFSTTATTLPGGGS